MFTLDAHSNYSLLEGTIPLQELVSFAKQEGSSYAALTDTNAMYGLIQFAKICGEQNIKPVLGAYIDDPNDNNLYVIFLAKNNEGYSHLCRIITARKLNENFSLVDLFTEPLFSLFIITSSIELLQKIKIDLSLRQNLFVELIATGKSKKKTRELFEFAETHKLQVVASHPAYFVTPNDFLLHEVVTAIRLNTTLENLDEKLLVDEEFCLKSPAEFAKKWRALPEAIWNAERIARECNVDLKFGEYKFPAYSLSPGESAFSYLWKKSFEGLSRRYQPIT